jgi:lipoprotein-anchoring transpeptidase ErfK/SrfK
VHVEANLAGVDLGDGAWGKEDITTDFTVGRDQRVQADVNSFHMVVLVDGKITKNYPVSYGKESVPGRATVSGIHVVTEKFPTFEMCNPQFDYCNVTEKWAVRINNNGEFIHENALTAAQQGKANVSHGCVNMGVGDAEDYYNSAIYGDPVEVTNTGVPMTEKDALYDWIYSFADWQKLSAL